MSTEIKCFALLVFGAILDHIFDWSDIACILYILGAILYRLIFIGEQVRTYAKEIKGDS